MKETRDSVAAVLKQLEAQLSLMQGAASKWGGAASNLELGHSVCDFIQCTFQLSAAQWRCPEPQHFHVRYSRVHLSGINMVTASVLGGKSFMLASKLKQVCSVKASLKYYFCRC